MTMKKIFLIFSMILLMMSFASAGVIDDFNRADGPIDGYITL